MLRPDDTAPAFRADAVMPGGLVAEVTLAGLRGRWALLLFYPRDFTTVCPTEIRELSKRAGELRALSAEPLAFSVDDLATHRRWIAEVLGPLQVALVADPGGAVARAYGAWLEGEGVAGRATYLVDPEGRIRWAAMYDLEVGRSISEVVRVLEALQAGGPAPAEWRSGQAMLSR